MPDSAPECVVQPGQLPEFWDRSAVFCANLASMFFDNEGGFNKLREEISGVATYGGRFVPIIDLLFTGGRNVLVLEEAPDEAMITYFGRDLGLGIPEFAYLDHWQMAAWKTGLSGDSPDAGLVKLADFLAGHPVQWIDGFVTDDGLAALADRTGMRTISSVEGSRRGNNKYLLHQFLEQEGFPVFETRYAEHPDEVPECLRQLSTAGYRAAAIKAQIGASGIGLVKLGVDDPEPSAPAYLFHEGPCMVQGWLQPGERDVTHIRSPSVQLFLSEHRVTIYDLTEQLLGEDSIHQGNLSPPEFVGRDDALTEELFRQASAAGAWLHAQGYRGTCSADFLVVDRTAGRDVYVCELNARVTGATYPAMLARHYTPEGAWLMRNFRFPQALPGEDIVQGLRKETLLFEPGMKRGVLPINFNLNAERMVHKGQFLCLSEDVPACLHRLAELSDAFAGGTYDRD